MMLMFIAALTLGIAGSFHCIAMCGPIAMALPLQGNKLSKFSTMLLYNIGRSFTYSLLGAVAGLIGSGFVFFGLQQTVSLLSGIIILALVLLPRFSFFNLKGKTSKFFLQFRSLFSSLMTHRSKSAMFGVGLLNGLLPCGLVYIALAGSIAAGDVFKSSLFMAGFGLGTIPAMLGMSLFGHLVGLKFRSRVSKAIPVVMSVMAILMILRGMNLNIPYLSPGFSKENKTMSCCEKNCSPENKVITCHK